MTVDAVRRIAQAVLYEGYLLWPYRASAMKNQRRFTFGCVYPKAFADRSGGSDRSEVQFECLVEGDATARIDLELRWLHVVERRPATLVDGQLVTVDELVAAGERHVAWQEATERELHVPCEALERLACPMSVGLEVPAGEEHEWLDRGAGAPAAALVRNWDRLEGTVEARAVRLGERLHRLRVRVRNTAAWDGVDRHSALARTLASAHVVARTADAAFVSATDPPPGLAVAAACCQNEGLWPVLAGEPGAHHTVLAAPIVLGDHPQVAPESPGDHFDGSEIDALLVTSILALTDAEQREIRATDARASQILDRTLALTPEQRMRLHGAVRELQPVQEPRGELD
jgi:hypothetical protein